MAAFFFKILRSNVLTAVFSMKKGETLVAMPS